MLIVQKTAVRTHQIVDRRSVCDIALPHVKRGVDMPNDGGEDTSEVIVSDGPNVRLVPTPQEEAGEDHI